MAARRYDFYLRVVKTAIFYERAHALITNYQYSTKSMFLLWEYPESAITASIFEWTIPQLINQNFELNKSRQKFHHSLKEHHKISNIPKFRCKML